MKFSFENKTANSFPRIGKTFCFASAVLLFPVLLTGADPKSAKSVPAVKKQAAVKGNSETKMEFDRDIARGKEYIRLKSEENDIDDLVKKAVAEYRSGEFEKSIAKYLDAKSRLEKLLKDVLRLEGVPEVQLQEQKNRYSSEKYVKRLNSKIASCEVAVSKCYYYWAQTIYFEAEKSAKAADFDRAIEKCRKAYEIYPPCKEEMEKMISKYREYRERAIARDTFKEQTSDEEEHKKKNVLLRQGEVLYRTGQWDKARAKFEQVIVIDPYNEQAIDYLRKVGRKLSASGRRRMDLVHSERIAESGWGALTPIISYDANETGGMLAAEGIEKEAKNSPIKEKLSSIMINSIDFDDTPLSAVITTLIQLSKENDTDPAKRGINIVAIGKLNRAAGLSGEEENEEKANAGKKEGTEDKDEGPSSNNPPVTLSIFNKISLEDAIKRVCENIKAVYKINAEDGVVEIAASTSELEDALKTEYFTLERKLSAESLVDGNKGSIHETYFRTVPLPEGAYTALDHVAGRLIVTNTPENIREMRKIFKKINRPVPQILIQAKFVDVKLTDLEELGFQYTFSREDSNVAYVKNPSSWTYDPANPTTKSFDNNINIYTNTTTDGSNKGWYSYYGTSSSLPYKSSDGQIIDPSTGTASSSTTNTITYYYKDAPTGDSSITWGRNSPMTRVYGKDGTPTYTVDEDTQFGKVWQVDAFTNQGYGLNAQIYALDQAGATDVLYCPRITTNDGGTAMLDMVVEKYYPTDWDEPELTTMDNMPILIGSVPDLEEHEEGILFQVTPTLDKNDPYYRTITLQFDQLSVINFTGWDDYTYNLPTDDGTGNYVNVPNVMRMPIFNERTVDTMIQCNDNATIVIGGMIQDESSVINDKYPILGDIPLVGRLFQSKGRNTFKKNLLIFVTCRLVMPDGSPYRSREDSGTISFKY